MKLKKHLIGVLDTIYKYKVIHSIYQHKNPLGSANKSIHSPNPNNAKFNIEKQGRPASRMFAQWESICAAGGVIVMGIVRAAT